MLSNRKIKQIRKDYNQRHWSIESIASSLNISSTTVRKYIKNTQEQSEKNYDASLSLEPYRPIVYEWLKKDLTTYAGQRHRNWFIIEMSSLKKYLN